MDAMAGDNHHEKVPIKLWYPCISKEMNKNCWAQDRAPKFGEGDQRFAGGVGDLQLNATLFGSKLLFLNLSKKKGGWCSTAVGDGYRVGLEGDQKESISRTNVQILVRWMV